MADLPEPVDMTTSVSRPASTDSIASRWPGRSASKPKASRAARSMRSSTDGDSPNGPVTKPYAAYSHSQAGGSKPYAAYSHSQARGSALVTRVARHDALVR